MRAYLVLWGLFLLVIKSYGQVESYKKNIDSLTRIINAKQNLATKVIDDTAWLGYPGGPRLMGNYFTVKYQFERNEPVQLIKVTKEKTIYYYYLNELVKVQDRTERPLTMYFQNGQLIHSNAAKKDNAFLSKYHLANAKRFLEMFVAKR